MEIVKFSQDFLPRIQIMQREKNVVAIPGRDQADEKLVPIKAGSGGGYSTKKMVLRRTGLALIVLSLAGLMTSCRNGEPWQSVVLPAEKTGTLSPPPITFSIATNTHLRQDRVHGRHIMADDIIALKRASDTYLIKYSRCTDESHRLKKTPVGDSDSGVGLSIPSRAGWYSNCAVEMTYNTTIFTRLYEAQYAVVTNQDKVLVGFVWDVPEIQAFIIFKVGQHPDALLCELTVIPRQKFDRVSVTLRNFPAYMLAWNKTPGERWVVTAGGRENTVRSWMDGDTWKSEPVKTISLVLPDDRWIFYADKILDYKRDSRSEGPCGLVVLPEGIRGGYVENGGYGIQTILDLPPGGGSYRLAFMEFPAMCNRAALVKLIEEKTRIEETLAHESFEFLPLIRRNVFRQVSRCRDRIDDIEEEIGIHGADWVEYDRYNDLVYELEDGISGSSPTLKEMNEMNASAPLLFRSISEFGLRQMVE